MKKNIFLIFCLSILFGCSFHVLGYLITHIIGTTDATAPLRPPNLPSDAFWQGGVDGGYWYSCKNTKTGFEFHCKIYGDDGSIIMEDDFELYISLYRANKKIPMKDFQKQTHLTADEIGGFDNSFIIHTQGSLVLKSKNYTWDNSIPYGISE